MRFARALRTYTLPLVSLASLLAPQHYVAAQVFGETGVSNPMMTWTGGPVSCSNGNMVRMEWVISQTDSSMNGQAHQPMAESGLPTVMLSFNHNILSIAQSAPSKSTFSGNVLTQTLVDDGPNDVQQLTFDGITCSNFMTLQYSMTAQAPATGTTMPMLNFPIKGTNGYSATPVAVVATPTNAPGTTNAPGPVTFGETGVTNPMMTWTGGAVRCSNNNVVRFEWVISQTDSSMNGQAHQPMAESGLPTVKVTFNHNILSVAQSAPTATTFSGQTFTQNVIDDGPNVVQELTFDGGVNCNNFNTPGVLVYSMSAQAPATGTTMPLLPFPIKGTNGFSATPVTLAPPTKAPTNAPGTIGTGVTQFGETGVTNPMMTWTGGAVRCMNNNVVRYEWVISQTDSSMNGQAHQPMAESGLPIVTVSFNHNILTLANSAPVAATFSGNSFTQPTQDDGPNVVQEMTFDGIDCNNFQTLMYSMSAQAPATGTTTPLIPFPIKGTNGFSATPVTVVKTTTAPTTANTGNTGGTTTTGATQFGETGVTNPMMTWTGGPVRCANGNTVRFEWTISQTDSSMNGAAHQPMAESGLPNVVLSFNHNILSVAQSAPSQSTTTISGNKLMQNVVDDGPNVVQELTFDGGVTCTNFQTPGVLVYSMTATAPATGTTAPAFPFPIKATVGFSATPVTVGSTGTTTTTTTTTTPTQATTPTKSATTAPTTAPTQATNGVTSQNIVKVTGGVNGCFGSATTILQYQVSISNDGGKTFNQPMAENGLPHITVTFNNPATFQGTVFNVGNSQVSGSTWQFDLLDDQPNVGVGLTFTSGTQCINGQFTPALQYHITATLNGVAWAVQSNANGFVAGTGTFTQVMPPSATTPPPTTAINRNAFGTNGVTNVVQMFTQSGNCWNNAKGAQAEILFNIGQTDSSSPTNPHAPMDETGIPTVTMTFGSAVTVSGTFNVANSISSGNTWTFTEMNDQPVIGGAFQFGTDVQCINGQLTPFSFTISAQANGVIMPTTSNAPGFKPAAANSLDDGSATNSMAAGSPTTSGSSVSIPLIIGIIVGIVILVIVAALVVRQRRNKSANSVSAPPKVAWYIGKDTADNNV